MYRNGENLRLALPKGRMQEGVLGLLAAAGMSVRAGERDYRPRLGGRYPGGGADRSAGGERGEADWSRGIDLKMLKPQNIVEMLRAGSRDAGFAGADWVAELDPAPGGSLVEVLDTGLDPVRLVAAAPESLLSGGRLPDRSLVVASEYENLAAAWIRSRGLDATVLRSYGATEVFPPEDADCVVDNSSSGATLRANGLCVVDVIMDSTTRLYANPEAMDDPGRRARIEWLAMLCRSVLEARDRVMLEVNVDADRLDALIRLLPALKEPTVSRLMGDCGYAVKVATPRSSLPSLIPAIRSGGGSGIVITEPSQIVV